MSRRSRTARGFTLVEAMISSVILLVAMIGFIAMVQLVLSANATAHRRTIGTFARGALLDQMAVMPRRIIGSLPQQIWYVDECYDADARVSGVNLLRAPDFQCPQGSHYRRWLQVTPVAATPSTFQLGMYVERIEGGCTPATREASVNCVSADMFVND